MNWLARVWSGTYQSERQVAQIGFPEDLAARECRRNGGVVTKSPPTLKWHRTQNGRLWPRRGHRPTVGGSPVFSKVSLIVVFCGGGSKPRAITVVTKLVPIAGGGVQDRRTQPAQESQASSQGGVWELGDRRAEGGGTTHESLQGGMADCSLSTSPSALSVRSDLALGGADRKAAEAEVAYWRFARRIHGKWELIL